MFAGGGALWAPKLFGSHWDNVLGGGSPSFFVGCTSSVAAAGYSLLDLPGTQSPLIEQLIFIKCLLSHSILS